ncbi:hypothetical protein [Kitasatospora indigofera]|uniref:hypothetical protein n=1 Tax=Kitasatospora indigofera TaxID=67307 RepID=UPI0033B40F64
MFGRKDKPQLSGQQRRAKANRAADRAGHAAMDAKVRRTSALQSSPPTRAWWRSS